MAQSISDHPPAHKSGGIFIALVPWVLFTLIAQHGTLKLGAIAALVIAIGICLYAMRDGGRPKMLEVAAVVSFAVFTIVSLVADPSLTHWLTRYARAIAAAALAVLVFATLPVMPFTESYAREAVPRQYWTSPQFKAINRRLSALWGGVFAAMTVSHVIAGAIDRHGTDIIFNWVIPVAMVVWAVKQSSPAGDAAPTAGQAA